MSVCLSRLILRAFALGFGGLFLWLGPVEAETPSEVVEQASGDGVYIGSGVGPIDEDLLVATVERAQRIGLRLLIVAPADPEPDPEAFALRVRQAADVDGVLLFGPDGGIYASVTDDYKDGIIRALSAARAASTPDVAADQFLTELTTEPDRPLPDVILTIVRAVIYLVVLLGLAALAEHLYRRWKRKNSVAQKT